MGASRIAFKFRRSVCATLKSMYLIVICVASLFALER